MLQNRTRSGGSLLLAGLAAFAYYKYSKMTPEERRSMFDGLKEKGKKLIHDYVPADIRDKFMKKDNPGHTDDVSEGSYYPA
ncbi:hypothetical protein FC093_10140 [Ilyomonas limi]|uniref:YtxH domain-containing protein n=1 Tax=Ilyomonas limi TaxID=2575867 RepID=A0A4U3L0W8_9BACT|nr:hypothetical protein [Ilyomonas limi]TKK68480.1 hypothetical protein FC093_10140 [Ilyomonas limi]